ncbi:MAG TPA: hypothetical protein VG265_04260 [Gaiellaceae bacterium]|nr:hypothetical protein [Gaiellaceae bacterium]
MSAVATAEVLPVSDASPVHEVPAGVSIYEMNAAEQNRWMIWFGIPALMAAIFVGAALGTGHAWLIGLAITAIVVDIFVLVWLAMSSDTNGLIGEPASH